LGPRRRGALAAIGGLKALREFVKELAKTFTQEEVMSFSRIVTLNDDYPSLQQILSEAAPAKKPLEKQGRSLFGLPVEHAVILRAEPPKGRLNKRNHRRQLSTA
jgi:hypothetical protein